MQLTVGEIIEGKITAVKDYGVFVDLGNGKFGMVHISEIAKSYVSEIREFVKEGDTVKVKVLSTSDDGKVSLSIKQADDSSSNEAKPERRERRNHSSRPAPTVPDGSYVWTAKKNEATSFEDMMSKFKATSDEKFSDLKRKNPDAKRNRRSGGR